MQHEHPGPAVIKFAGDIGEDRVSGTQQLAG
jgi:hypothetical protein